MPRLRLRLPTTSWYSEKTMLVANRSIELALVCDVSGRLTVVLHDALGLTRQRMPETIYNLIEPGSRTRAEQLLARLHKNGSVFEYELKVQLLEKGVPMLFAGAYTGNGYCIIGTFANTAFGLMEVLEELMQINNNQLNSLRTVMQQQSNAAKVARERATTYFDEVQQLNSDLLNTQRELARQNILLSNTLEDLEQAHNHLTEQRDEIERMNAELRRSNDEFQQFAFVASHELQVPLRRIRSFVDLLAEHYQPLLDEKGERWLGYIVKNASDMQQLVNDILSYARVETRGQTIVHVSLASIIDYTQRTLASTLAASGGQITRDELPTVWSDAQQLSQLFANLAENALLYRSEAPPHIHVSAQRLGTEWQIAVRDNGIGIAPEHHQAVFEMLRRINPDPKHPGNGIGLAICRQIVRRNGGRIWVESQLGAGSTFYFTLPDQQGGAHDTSNPSSNGTA